MTANEWKELCDKYEVTVIGVNYQDMSHDEGIKCLELLKMAMSVAFARKYDPVNNTYENYALPEGASLYEDDMNKDIACAECGKKIKYGMSYTSRIIQNDAGFGYAVCKDCYYKNNWKDSINKS